MRYEPLNGLSRLLIILLRTGEINVTSLQKEFGASLNTLYRYIELGRKLGLIIDRYEKEPPNRRFLSLTEKGRKVAKRLKEIYEIMGWLQT